MTDKVTAASAIKAMQDLVESFTEEDWKRIMFQSAFEFCGMVKYDAEGRAEDGNAHKNKST